MFDPNQVFLAPGNDPGIRVEATHPGFPSILEDFADSFAPLDIWGDGLRREYAGAPLRSFPSRRSRDQGTADGLMPS